MKHGSILNVDKPLKHKLMTGGRLELLYL